MALDLAKGCIVILGNIDTEKKVYVIAEVGNNHEGNYNLAEDLICKAKECGADAVKFQTFVPELYVSSKDHDRILRLEKFKFTIEQFHNLKKLAQNVGIDFFSTPFDLESARALNAIQDIFKISSGDNNYYDLIELIASFSKSTIISTGMTGLDSIILLVDFWQQRSSTKNLALLHCVSSYPVPNGQENLAAIMTLKSQFPELTIGYSDHTLGVRVAKLAVTAGARIIEKHFTIDKNYSNFRDHQLSADPNEMKELVISVAEISEIMGSGEKKMQICESEHKSMRRSLGAAKDLDAGVVITRKDLICIRPGTGIGMDKIESILGKKIIRSIAKGEILNMEDVSD